MGAMTFFTKAKGRTANEAFRQAIEQAFYDHGHGGYSGSVAEKDRFVPICVPAGEDPQAFAQRLVDQDDPRIDDKFGPAGAVRLGPEEWLFFGWASS